MRKRQGSQVFSVKKCGKLMSFRTMGVWGYHMFDDFRTYFSWEICWGFQMVVKLLTSSISLIKKSGNQCWSHRTGGHHVPSILRFVWKCRKKSHACIEHPHHFPQKYMVWLENWGCLQLPSGKLARIRKIIAFHGKTVNSHLQYSYLQLPESIDESQILHQILHWWFC